VSGPVRATAVSVGALLAERASQAPLRNAFIEGRSGRTVNWRQLEETAGCWRTFRQVPARLPSTRVGLAIADPVVAAASFLAALGCGVTVAPLDGEAPPGQLLEHIEQLHLGALVTDSTDGQLLDAAAASGVAVWSPGIDDLHLLRAGLRPRPGAPATSAALIMATSGTSGTPKIVPLAERQLVATATAVAGHHHITSQDCGYCPLPLFHINGLVVGVLSTLVAGSTLVVERRFSRRTFWPTVARYRVTWLNLVPAIIGVLSQSKGPTQAQTPHVRFARSAAAPLPVATATLFERRSGVAVLETYGMTEAASQIAANPLRRSERRPGSVGKPVGIDLRVVDHTRRPVPPGTAGDVEIRGERVVSEYWAINDSRPAWPATDGDGWLATGDVGFVDDDGFLYLLARADDVINRGGEKIYPGEIEDVLLGDARVTGAVVVGRAHSVAGTEPVAFVTTSALVTERAALVDDLRGRCAEMLSRSKRPADVTVVDILPAGPTGKVRRAELRRQLAGAAR